MRIGVFVTGAFSRRDRLDWVSGHVQMPLVAARILAAAGHDVTLITTKEPGAECLPYNLPPNLNVRVVQHASGWTPEHRIYAAKAVKQVLELLALLRRECHDVVHFWGGIATGWLLCTLKAIGIRSTAFYSPIKPPPRYASRLGLGTFRLAFRRVDRILATSDYTATAWAAGVGVETTGVLRPGVMRVMSGAPAMADRDSILFWHEGSYDSGVDVAMEAFRRLAPKYADVRFIFAVRPFDAYQEALERLDRELANVRVHFYPYRQGVSLPNLLGRTLFAVQPFRRLSINPQISVLETLYAGIPVIATAIESNPELVRHGENGLLIPPGDDGALSSAIERLLRERPLLDRMTQNARPGVEACWNWDTFGRQLLDACDELQ